MQMSFLQALSESSCAGSHTASSGPQSLLLTSPQTRIWRVAWPFHYPDSHATSCLLQCLSSLYTSSCLAASQFSHLWGEMLAGSWNNWSRHEQLQFIDVKSGGEKKIVLLGALFLPNPRWISWDFLFSYLITHKELAGMTVQGPLLWMPSSSGWKDSNFICMWIYILK